jgi:hypothetical protein
MNAEVDVAMYRAGPWAPDEGPAVRIQATGTTHPMTILRAGIPTGEVLSAGSGFIDIVLDSPLEYTAHVEGNVDGTWTLTVMN